MTGVQTCALPISPYLQNEFELSRNEARDILIEWMETFEQRHGE